MIRDKRILVIAPHTDDGELGCGGAIHRLAGSNEIYYAAFSTCRQSVPDSFEPDVLEKEVKEATGVLGINPGRLLLFDYEVRTFGYRRQEILDDLLSLKNKIGPEFVFIPSVNDVHQDHQTITQEALRAFRHVSLLGYELPWNNRSFNNACFISLGEEDLQAKLRSVSAYKSQAHRSYASADFLTSLATVRGVQAGTEYAEAFEVIRWII